MGAYTCMRPRLWLLSPVSHAHHRETPSQDNAKKYVELGHCGGKGSDAHKAAITGDTVGDPFKDTAGPSLHVVIKLLSTTILVLGPLFIGQASVGSDVAM